MSEIPGLNEGVEVIRVMFHETEVFIRLLGDLANWTLEKLAKVMALTYRHMQKKKSEMKEGEINFHDLITKNKSGIGMMQIENEHIDLLVKYAKNMGLSYSIMPDINKNDEYTEIAFPESMGEAFRYFISQHMDISKSYTYGEYFDNSNPLDMEEEIKGLGKEAVMYAKELKEKENEKITTEIDTSFLSESESKDMLLCAVPNTDDEYIRINKNDLIKKDNKYYISLYPNAGYSVVTKDENPVMKEKSNMIITGNEYKNAIINMPVNNLINKKKKEEQKGSVKLVLKNEKGELEQKIFNKAKRDIARDEILSKIGVSR